MLFLHDEREIEAPRNNDRTIYIYSNGSIHSKLLLELKLSRKKTSLADICRQIGYSKMRLFNSEGREFADDDLEYVKDKTTLYASKGDDFDPSSCFGEYNHLKDLGQGGFGKVILAEHRITHEKVAIKTIKTEVIGSAADVDNVFVEAEILKGLNHDNIVRVINCLTLSNMQVAIIMEYLEGGELLAYVEKKGRLSEEEAKVFFKQVVKAMFYCHQNSLIHRDLKLENLLLVNAEQKKVKIIDFGIAGVVSNFKLQEMDTGSLNYMAPECFFPLKDRKIDGGVDVWAIGVILYGMLVGDLPFKGNTSFQKIEQIKLGRYRLPKEVSEALSNECLDVLKKCLDPNPKNRIKIADLLMHPWSTDMNLPEMKSDKPTVVIIEKPRQLKQLPPVLEEKAQRQERDRKSMPKNRKSNIMKIPVRK